MANLQQNCFAQLKALCEGDAFRKRVENIMGQNAGAYISSIIDLVSQDGKLKQCDAGAILNECLKACAMKLPVNKQMKYAYIIPYNNKQKDAYGNDVKDANGNVVYKMEPQLKLSYLAYIQLALRTQLYRHINADVVYEGELSKIDRLTGEIELNGEKKSDTIVGYFAMYEMLCGTRHTVYFDIDKMAAYAKKYGNGLQKMGIDEIKALANAPVFMKQVGWRYNYNDMALKTVLLKLLGKWGQTSIEIMNAIDSETSVEVQSDNTVEEVAIDIDEQPKQLEATVQQTATEEVAQEVAVEQPESKASF